MSNKDEIQLLVAELVDQVEHEKPLIATIVQMSAAPEEKKEEIIDATGTNEIVEEDVIIPSGEKKEAEEPDYAQVPESEDEEQKVAVKAEEQIAEKSEDIGEPQKAEIVTIPMTLSEPEDGHKVSERHEKVRFTCSVSEKHHKQPNKKGLSEREQLLPDTVFSSSNPSNSSLLSLVSMSSYQYVLAFFVSGARCAAAGVWGRVKNYMSAAATGERFLLRVSFSFCVFVFISNTHCKSIKNGDDYIVWSRTVMQIDQDGSHHSGPSRRSSRTFRLSFSSFLLRMTWI